MSLQLKEITASNWEDCIRLKPAESQINYVASNLYSLAESKFNPGLIPLAVYAKNEMVGFIMYGVDPDDHNYWIYRLMVDEKHQRKGYGKEALLKVMEKIKKKPVSPVVMVGFHPENKGAQELYTKIGFQVGERAPWGEILGTYHLTAE